MANRLAETFQEPPCVAGKEGFAPLFQVVFEWRAVVRHPEPEGGVVDKEVP